MEAKLEKAIPTQSHEKDHQEGPTVKFKVEIKYEEAIPTQSRKKDHQEGPHSMCQWTCQARSGAPVKPLHQRCLPNVPGCFLTGPVEAQVDPRLEHLHLQWLPCCFPQGLLGFGMCMATQTGQRKQAGKSGSRRSEKQ